MLYGFDGEDCLEYFFEKSLKELAKIKEPINKDITINKMLSTSMIEDFNVFKSRPVQLKIKAPKGSNIFANGYILESEALIPVGTNIRILYIFKESGKTIIEALLI